MRDYDLTSKMLEATYLQVSGYEFYRDIFPDNENFGEMNTDFSTPNAIYLYRDNDKGFKRRIMLADTWGEDYFRYIKNNSMALCSGLTYRGKANRLEKAQRMNALIFDLDSVGVEELENILYLTSLQPHEARSIPMPTYTVLSGAGLHLYYVFDEPIELYPNIKVQLKSLKYDLTYRFWNPTITSKEKQIQYQSINQAFRMVGSINDKYKTEVIAFKTGDRISLDELNKYTDFDKNKVDVNRPFKPSKISLAEAKEQYPEWYQRVVVDGKKNLKKWDIKSKQGYALYDWWRSHAPQIKGGHRYFYLMCMSVYACKCDVPYEKLKKDMAEDFLIVARSRHSNELTDADMKSALEMYSREYYNFRIDDIEKLTDVRIERNKRNYRKQRQHMEIMRAVQTVTNPNWRNGNGRKPKKEIVTEWRGRNPEGRKSDCIKETGLAKSTVYKWWDC